MDTSFFLPPGRQSPEPEDILRLVQNCLARACMDSRFKKLVGWRGFAPCRGQDGAATCRLSHRRGIYGIAPDGFEAGPDAALAHFILHYFPHADEPLFECLSPAVALTVAEPGYGAKVRDFVAPPEFAKPFAIAGLTVGAGARDDVLWVSLDRLERQRVYSEVGIPAVGGAWVVPPGGIEQDVPSGSLARDFFDVLAAAASLCTGEPPRVYRREEIEAGDRMHESGGGVVEIPANDGGNARVLTSYVWGRSEAIARSRLSLPEAGHVTTWEEGDPQPKPSDTVADLCWRTHSIENLLAEHTHSPAADRRPGLIVLCGYLGSGKTTLLNQIIEHHRNHDAFVAVIQNEIGAKGVDAHLVEESESVESLDEGCICCTLAGNLAKAAQRLIERYHPERIVLETTGLANPLNLLDELAGLNEFVRLDVIVTLVDALHAAESLASSDVASDQIRGGDVIVLNKCDLVDADMLTRVRERLRELNGHAPIIETNFARVHPAMLLGDLDDALGREAAPYDAGRHAAVHSHGQEHDEVHDEEDGEEHGEAGHSSREHDHHDAHVHHHHHLEDGFSSTRVELPAGLTAAELFSLLDDCPVPAFRIKGIVDLADAPRPEVLQCVGGRREIVPLPSFYDGVPFLIFIGQNLDAGALHDYWDGVMCRPHPGQGTQHAACACTA
jgi:G3E family GTPase